MPPRTIRGAAGAVLIVAAVALAGAVIASCGGTSSSGEGVVRATESARQKLESCLEHSGVKTRVNGTIVAPGATRSELNIAQAKCGVRRGATARTESPKVPSLANPGALKALARYSACLHLHGIDISTTTTTNPAAAYDLGGAEISTRQFKAASKICRSVFWVPVKR
jgi:hypothetical protein